MEELQVLIGMNVVSWDLFESEDVEGREQKLAAGASVLRNFAGSRDELLWAEIGHVLRQSPLRNMVTPGGARMSVQMSNCGELGWISDRRGYRYSALDPLTHQRWPAMPEIFSELANEAAARAGFSDFIPDACLLNRYEPGIGLSLHQDRDERDFDAPIVSVSLGLPAVFLFGGEARRDKPMAIALENADVVVWGGSSRLRFHGIRPLKPGEHPLTGPYRFNLTLRKAG